MGWFRRLRRLEERVEALEGERLGDGIVAAKRRADEADRSWAPPEWPVEPVVLDSHRVTLPDGERPDRIDGPWLPYATGEGEWRPWDTMRSRFERSFSALAPCERRCWFLNGLERGSGLAGFEGVGPSEQERIMSAGPARAPDASGPRRTRVGLRQAIWEASQHATVDELRDLCNAVLREIEGDSP